MHPQSIKKILVPIDGSDESFSASSLAIEIAKKFESELLLLHVVTIDQSFRAVGLYGRSYDDVVKKHVDEAKKELDRWFVRISKAAEEYWITVSSHVVDTSISIVGEIVNYAEKNDIDMIVMGTKGMSSFSKLLMGSVATGVNIFAMPSSSLKVT